MTQPAARRRDPFQTTVWTMLDGAASERPGLERDECWRWLIDGYRPVIEALVRRRLAQYLRERGSRVSAVELCDGFFSYLFESGALSRVDARQGRFRAFLQGVLRNYLMHATRTGEGTPAGERLELDDGAGLTVSKEESQLELEEERAWAMALLRSAVLRLRTRSPKEAEVFERIYNFDPERADLGIEAPRSAGDVARELGLSRVAVNVRLHRARLSVRALVRFQVAETTWDNVHYHEEADLMESHLAGRCPGLAPATRHHG